MSDTNETPTLTEEEIAGLRSDADAGLAYVGYHDSQGNPPTILLRLLAYADQLHEQLEAEREKRRIPTHYESNGEAGDGQTVCDICGGETDEGHEPSECAQVVALNIDHGWHVAGVATDEAEALKARLQAAERESLALRIWSELVCYVGASPADQDNFVQHMASERPPSEWRFSGSLGFGGKFYPSEMAVRCYPEDETPGRLAMIRNANVALARIAKRHGKDLSAYDRAATHDAKGDATGGGPNPSK